MILPGRSPTSIRRLIARSFATSAAEYRRSPLSSRTGLGKPYRRSHMRSTSFDSPASRSTALMLRASPVVSVGGFMARQAGWAAGTCPRPCRPPLSLVQDVGRRLPL